MKHGNTTKHYKELLHNLNINKNNNISTIIKNTDRITILLPEQINQNMQNEIILLKMIIVGLI